MIADDSSIEFDFYEGARQHLTEFLESEGYDKIEAERAAFYIIQGVRNVPKLLSILKQSSDYSPAQLRTALNGVFDNLNSLNKAHLILTKPFVEKP